MSRHVSISFLSIANMGSIKQKYPETQNDVIYTYTSCNSILNHNNNNNIEIICERI